MLNEDLKDAIDILPWSKSGPHRITSGKGKGQYIGSITFHLIIIPQSIYRFHHLPPDHHTPGQYIGSITFHLIIIPQSIYRFHHLPPDHHTPEQLASSNGG